MTSPRFVFRSRWHVDAEPGAALAVLADPAGYPQWWPQVRSAHETAPGEGVCVIRSALPVSLRLRLRQDVVDERSGLLRATLAGDLEGWSSWTVHPDGGIDFAQECVVVRPGLRDVAGALRPLLVANHAWMMRRGEQGLRRRLAGSAGSVEAAGSVGSAGPTR